MNAPTCIHKYAWFLLKRHLHCFPASPPPDVIESQLKIQSSVSSASTWHTSSNAAPTRGQITTTPQSRTSHASLSSVRSTSSLTFTAAPAATRPLTSSAVDPSAIGKSCSGSLPSLIFVRSDLVPLFSISLFFVYEGLL